MRRTVLIPVVLFAMGVTAALLATENAVGGPQSDYPDKITICHRTGRVNNPYVVIRISTEAAMEHLEEHTGDSFDHKIHTHSGDKWGDIIPPIPGISTGLNWDGEGQAIWANGCQLWVEA